MARWATPELVSTTAVHSRGTCSSRMLASSRVNSSFAGAARFPNRTCPILSRSAPLIINPAAHGLLPSLSISQKESRIPRSPRLVQRDGATQKLLAASERRRSPGFSLLKREFDRSLGGKCGAFFAWSRGFVGHLSLAQKCGEPVVRCRLSELALESVPRERGLRVAFERGRAHTVGCMASARR